MSHCSLEASKIGFSEADTEILRGEIAKKSGFLSKIKEDKVKIDIINKDLAKRNIAIKSIESKDRKLKIASRIEHDADNDVFDKEIAKHQASLAKSNEDLEQAKSDYTANKERLKREGKQISHISHANDSQIKRVKSEIQEYKEDIQAIRDRKKLSKEQRRIRDSKFKFKISELKAQRKEIMLQKRKLNIAKNLYSKHLNDNTLELKNDYKQAALSYVKRNYATVKRRQFLDSVIKNPHILADMFINAGKTTKHNMWAKLHLNKGDFNAYQLEFLEANEAAYSKELDLNDLNNKDVKSFVDHLRHYIDTKHMSTTGKKYFSSDLEHVTKINGDTMRKNLDQFFVDVLAHTDHKALRTMFNDQRRLHHSGYEDVPEQSEDSEVGATRKSLEEKSIEQHLAEFKIAFQSGNNQAISFNKMKFKSNEDYAAFNKKYSNYDISQGYQRFITTSYLRTHLMNQVMGGSYIDLSKMPDSAFHAGFKRNWAQGYIDQFKGGYGVHSDKTNLWLVRVGKYKAISMMSKAIKLVLYGGADESSRAALEIMKNNKLNLFTDTSGFMKNLFSGYHNDLLNFMRINKDITKNILQINQKQVTNSLLDTIKGFHEYDGISYLEEAEDRKNNKFFSLVEKFNKKFVFDPMHVADNALRQGSWAGITNNFINHREDAPTFFHNRLDRIGFDKHDIQDVKDHIAENQSSTINIEDFSTLKLRDKLRTLKYDTDISAVPLDVTPMPFLNSNLPPAINSFVSFFWRYHLKAAASAVKTVLMHEGLTGKLSSAIFYSIRSMPTNLAINAFFNFLYTGENPFNEANWETTVFSSFAGSVSRPMEILLAYGTGEKNTLGGALSNPMITPITHLLKGVEHIGEASYDYFDDNAYQAAKQGKKVNSELTKSVMGITPFGSAIIDTYNIVSKNN